MTRAERKRKRREEAEKRMKQREKRSPEQQLAKLDSEGWRAKKERARLLKRIRNIEILNTIDPIPEGK